MPPLILPPTTTIRPGAATSPPRAVPPLQLRSQAQAADRIGPAGLRLAAHGGALHHRRARREVEDPRHIGPFLGIVLGLALVAHLANRWLVPDANAVILPIAALLNGIGYVVIARWDPRYAKSQAGWAALGVRPLRAHAARGPLPATSSATAICCCCWPASCWWLPLFFSPINGARLWVHFGGLPFQPIEFSKILLCIFFASYFAENKELLSIPTAQIGNRLFLDPRR